MPGFDGTGPRGAGPMTGGARGYCNADRAVGSANMPRGRGYGRGYGEVSGGVMVPEATRRRQRRIMAEQTPSRPYQGLKQIL